MICNKVVTTTWVTKVSDIGHKTKNAATRMPGAAFLRVAK